MGAQGTESGRWSRLELALFLAFLAIAGASLVWLVHPWYERANDASIYVITARALAHGEGYTYLGEPFTVRPPGFSVLLAPFVAGEHVDFHALNLYVSAFGIAGLALLFAWSRERLGGVVAFALVLALWFAPAYQHLCNMVLSDVPGTALLVLCLLLERAFSRREPSSAALEGGASAWSTPRRATLFRDGVLGLAIGLASLVRSMNVLLAPAIVLARACEAWSGGARGVAFVRAVARRSLPLAIGAALALEPWTLWSAAHRPAGAVDQLYVHSYSTAMWRTDIGDPNSPLRPLSEIAQQVPARVEKLTALLGSRMQAPDTGAVELVLGALVLLAVLVVAWRRRASAEWFVLGASAMLFVFVSFLDRHALPVWMLASVAALEALLLALEALRVPRAAARGIAVAVIASVAWVDWAPRKNWETVRATHEQMERYCDAVAKSLAPDARPAAWLGWHFSVYLGRPVWSLQFVAQRSGAGALPAMLEREHIDTLLTTELMPLRPDVEQALAPLVKSSVDVDLGRVERVR